MKASQIASSLTILMTDELDVKINASFSLKIMTTNQNINPTSRVFTTDTIVANFAPFALPAPSSFATRTLSNELMNVARLFINLPEDHQNTCSSRFIKLM